MGLFGPSKKELAVEAAEEEIMRALSTSEQLDVIVTTIDRLVAEDKAAWITECQGYYDSRNRTVRVERDLFEIIWYSVRYETDQAGNRHEIRDIADNTGYRYTDCGYMPLHGTELVSTERVVSLWASVVRERLQAKFSQCKFRNVIQEDDNSWFTYSVPALTWKDWF